MSSQKFTVRVPASTANLGSGFDTIGCALELFLTIQVTCYESPVESGQDRRSAISQLFKVRSFRGQGEQDIPTDSSNLVVKSAVYLMQQLYANGIGEIGDSVPLRWTQVDLDVSNDIPVSRGLGSSASAIVAGLMIANEVGQFNLTRRQLLEHACHLEGHPDNVGACLLGGLFVGFTSASNHVRSSSIRWNHCIKAVVAVPDFQVSTSEARNVLPDSYSRQDVVANIQRVAVLIALLSSSAQHTPHYFSSGNLLIREEEGDADNLPDPYVMHDLLNDAVHQPYRMELVPGLREMISDITPDTCEGVLGIVLSGAGPTVLALATSNFEHIGAKMVSYFARHSIKAKSHILSICDSGAALITE